MEQLENIDLNAIIAEYWPAILSGALKVLGAILVLVIGLRIAGWLAGVVRKQTSRRAGVDETLGAFFGSLVRWFVTAAVLIASLQVFGVQATSFVAVLGALTLAIGLSLQGALGNIASGVMIMLFRPYKNGDFVEIADAVGTVKEINLFQTILATLDNVKIIIPNTEAIDGIIKNYSGYDTRRCDLVFGIDYDDDMDKALGIIKGIVDQDDRILPDPEPFVKVTNLGDSSVDITCRLWCQATDLWNLKFDLTKQVKEAFDAQGISIPYPHRTLVQKTAN
ncbi:MAG: mechanosensitive ion channel protein MscS [Henriciella sp.]|jgi:small conductance mechanosensitive channel|uniref:mechanosensitive ion channel family protein n=1 Tax=Henriciella sp. TaxID=1968823 RepID=UPI000C10F5A9|nr:mechanosensitive ion channel domain-containing protein [Henriciella sp.]MAN75286.1 mechanosensitive ion channel protein MscS [Henriciella sp.]MBF33455.1 mechanosensitive ion channel protein MscS [Hyphomonadaceae bacterium]PHR79872.1 MAG: mechanosensitive ion channel protein MscS [Henriciella sp.]